MKGLVLAISAHLASHGGLRVLLEEEGIRQMLEKGDHGEIIIIRIYLSHVFFFVGIINIAKQIVTADNTTLARHAAAVLIAMGVLESYHDPHTHHEGSADGGILGGSMRVMLSSGSKMLGSTYSNV